MHKLIHWLADAHETWVNQLARVLYCACHLSQKSYSGRAPVETTRFANDFLSSPATTWVIGGGTYYIILRTNFPMLDLFIQNDPSAATVPG